MHYVAQLTKEENATLVEFPDAPGCLTFAETDEDVAAVAREALEVWLEAHLVDGQAPPQPKARRAGAGKLVVRVASQLAAALEIRWRREDFDLKRGQR